MKKYLVVLVMLAMAGAANADTTVNGASYSPTNGWMNVFDTSNNYLWGSGWGIPALRVTGTAGDLWLRTNVNCHDDGPTDPYWALGAKNMEALDYTEILGLAGQTLTFNFAVGNNDLAAAGYVTEAFIKTLEPSLGWATTQQTYVGLPVGAGTISLAVVGSDTAVVQYGFRVYGLNDGTGTATSLLGVHIIPEPATLALLGLGGLVLRRRK